MTICHSNIHQGHGEQFVVVLNKTYSGNYIRTEVGQFASSTVFTASHTETQKLVDAFCAAAIKAGFTIPTPKDDATDEPYSVAELEG